jgi:catechol 2,3-dioxygenase-like lactoylglutathione lyase family enzyme
MAIQVNRREMLALIGAAAASRAWADTALLHPTRIDHVSLAVKDIDQAMMFYRTLFGNDVMKDKKTDRRFQRIGPCYLSIAPAAAGQAIRIDHICAGLQSVELVAAAKTAVESAGLPTKGSTRDFTIADPDGVSFQVAPNNAWPKMPNAAPEAGGTGEPPLFRAIGMHHVNVRVSDMEKSTAFYRKLLGDVIRHQGNPPQPRFDAGETTFGLYYPVAGKPPEVDHFSVLVEPFDAAAAVTKLQAMGAKAKLAKNGSLNEFYDPQGIRLQVSTVDPAANH